jgi:sec-independent protein translocase protein TatC
VADDSSVPSDESDDLGARKSFWGHVQDLRVALVRSSIALGLALVICLLVSNRIVQVLEYPLRHIHMFESPQPTVTVKFGATTFGPFAVTREQFPGLPPGPAPHPVYQAKLVPLNGQQVVALTLDPAATAADLTEVRLNNFSPTEPFLVAFHVALYAAVAVSSPFWIYFMGGFMLPALKENERKVILGWIGWSVTLFLTGVLLTYFLLLPVALRATLQYSELLGFKSSDWRAEDYISFVSKFIFGMGLGFQFPIVVLFLVKLGLVTSRQLAHYRRHMVVLSLVLGALLTTPEVITQVAMAVPLYLLYETCIWIAWYWERQKRRAEGIIEIPSGS